MKIIQVSQPIPTFSGYANTVDFRLLQKKKKKKGIRVRICQIMTMNTKAHNTIQEILDVGKHAALYCTAPVICWAQWLLGEGGPRHRLAVWRSWFVSHQRSVSSPRLKVADRCGESGGLWWRHHRRSARLQKETSGSPSEYAMGF